MAHLHDDRGTVSLEALQQHRLPERAAAVQRRGDFLLYDVEQFDQRAPAGQPRVSEVAIEAEVRIHDPGRQEDRGRRRHHLLPEPQDQAAGPIVGVDEPAPLRDAVQYVGHGQQRTRVRVFVAAEEKGVEGRHAAAVLLKLVRHRPVLALSPIMGRKPAADDDSVHAAKRVAYLPVSQSRTTRRDQGWAALSAAAGFGATPPGVK